MKENDNSMGDDDRYADLTSTNYTGQKGHEYFNAQKSFGTLAARWNLPLFLPYLSNEDRVLDFGCGGGDLLRLLPVREKVGVDINPSALEQARKLKLEVHASLKELSPKTYSRIISNHALEHVPNPLQVLQELHHLIDPEGLLIVLLPLDDWRSRDHRSYPPQNDLSAIHHHLYNWDSFKFRKSAI